MPAKRAKTGPRVRPAAETNAQVPNNRPRIALAALILVLAGLAAFWNSFGGVFVLDDDPSIVHNPNVRSVWPLSQAMSAPPEVTVAGRPVVSLTLAWSHALTGLTDLRGFHAINLAIHLTAALALFGVCRRTLDASRNPSRATPALAERRGPSWLSPSAATPLALAIALIWCVHPLQTGSVTYIVQRAESLMGLFYLLTLYCAIRAHEPSRRAWWIAGSIAACALGMGSKEVMVTAPILVALWDWLFARPGDAASRPSRLPLYAGLAATWLLLGWLMWTHPRPQSVGFGFNDWPWWRYLLTQAGVIVHYLRLAIVPYPLVLDYGWPSARSAVAVLPQLLLVVALLSATVWRLWRRRPEGFLGAWFFLILAPTSSVVPIVTEIAAEHRMYLPLAAVAAAIVLAAAALLSRLPDRSQRRAIGTLMLAACVVTLAVMTSARNRVYASVEDIWLDTVEKRPQNARAHNNYAISLLTRGDHAGAAEHFRAALALDPRFATAAANLGVSLCKLAKCDEGIGYLERAIELAPASTLAHRDLAEAYAAQGRHGPAVTHFLKALEGLPDDVFLLNRTGWLLATSPDDAVRNGSKALALAERAVALTSRRDEVALDTLAVSLAETGQFEKAAAAGAEALAVARAHGNQALIPELETRLAMYRAARGR